MQEYMQRLIAYIADREGLSQNLLKQFDECDRRAVGLPKASKSVQENTNEENTRKMLSTALNILKDQMEINKQLLSLAVLYISNDDFEGRQAQFAIKTGQNPKDVLGQILKNKFTK